MRGFTWALSPLLCDSLCYSIRQFSVTLDKFRETLSCDPFRWLMKIRENISWSGCRLLFRRNLLVPSATCAALWGFWYIFCNKIVWNETESRWFGKWWCTYNVQKITPVIGSTVSLPSSELLLKEYSQLTWLKVGLLWRREQRSPWRHAPILK